MAFWLPLLATVAGTALSGGISSKIQSDAAGQAATAQANAAVEAARIQAASADRATALQGQVYQDQRGIYAPQARLGAGALARQAIMAGLSPEEAQNYYSGVDQAYSAPLGGARGAFSTQYDGYGDLTPEQRASAEAYLQSRPDLQQEWDAALANGDRPFELDPLQFAAYYQSREPAAGASPQATTQQASAGPSPIDGYTATSWQTTDPGYAFRMSEGLKALERGAAASGRLGSGAYDKALTRFGQDYASNEYMNAFNRLGAIAGQGTTANAALTNAGNAFATGAGNSIMASGNAQAAGVRGAGDARASGYQAQGQAWGDFFGNTVPSAIGTVYGAWGGKKGAFG